MQRIVIATTNKNKIDRLKRLLSDFTNYEVIGLEAVNIRVEEPEETAKTCVGIAAQKALHYAEQLPAQTLILTQDDTIDLAGVLPQENPETSIKQPVIVNYGSFTDKNAAKYYTELAQKYGGSIPMTFHYGHAIAFKTAGDHPRTIIISSQSKLQATLVNEVNGLEKVPGYFLAAVMQVDVGGALKHFSQLTEEEKMEADSNLKESIEDLLNQIEMHLCSKGER